MLDGTDEYFHIIQIYLLSIEMITNFILHFFLFWWNVRITTLPWSIRINQSFYTLELKNFTFYYSKLLPESPLIDVPLDTMVSTLRFFRLSHGGANCCEFNWKNHTNFLMCTLSKINSNQQPSNTSRTINQIKEEEKERIVCLFGPTMTYVHKKILIKSHILNQMSSTWFQVMKIMDPKVRFLSE
jgi:hypothetical protein